ncbi:MAG: heavy-metal-associated domain-containing protein [Chloroflexi bacterium]|nr:MAG: heavy-metal-associated domain-containing protein [Chloroflexota bacterium]
MRSGLRLVLALGLMLGACAPAPRTAARDLPPVQVLASAANDEVAVNVLELICQSCAEHIIAGCKSIPGVASVDVNRKEKLLTLHFDSSFTTRERVLAAVDEVVATIP